MTGSTRGIGLAIAKEFLTEGALVAIHGKNPDRLRDAEEMLEAFGHVLPILSDISTEEGITHLFEEVDSVFKGVDILVNNAALHEASSVSNAGWDAWERTIHANLRSVVMSSQLAFERMKNQHYGVVINASSFAACVPALPYGIYSSIKSSVLTLTRILAAEFAPWNIRVNAYIPGSIATDMNKGFVEKGNHSAVDPIALGRFGTAEEVAAPIVFLSSGKASYITGAALEISGGKFTVQNPASAWTD